MRATLLATLVSGCRHAIGSAKPAARECMRELKMTEQVDVVRHASSDGFFDWQMPTGRDRQESWNKFAFDTAKWWGTFPNNEAPAIYGRREDPELFTHFPWAVGPFRKHAANPVLAPSPGKWDQGRCDGGVHNGSIVRHGGQFHYVYRGERPIDVQQD